MRTVPNDLSFEVRSLQVHFTPPPDDRIRAHFGALFF
jgi:hypothetical protein